MKMEKKENLYKNFFLLLIIFMIDFCSKLYIVYNYNLYQFQKIVSIINIYYVHNHQIAYTFFTKFPQYLNYLIIIINVITITVIFQNNYLNHQDNIQYILILGGSIGNTFDRIQYGYIIDFIDIYLYHIHVVILNFADIIIIIGLIFLIKNKMIQNSHIM
ncbi:Lipoprotein signal peptidase [Buchnera aphidicola (Myzocallis carpini)]